MTGKLAMTEFGPGTGEAAEGRRKRQRWTIIGAIAGAGFVSGFAFALVQDADSLFDGTIPAWLAIALTGLWLVAMIGGCWMLGRRADEVERHNNLWSTAIGGSVLLIGYPAWYLLWRGGLVVEPIHEIMFLAFYAVAIGAYLWKKFR